MYKSKSTSEINTNIEPSFRFSIFRASTKDKKPVKDPFSTLNRNNSAKLLPVSPSYLGLPSLQGKISPKLPTIQPNHKSIISKTPRCEEIFKINRLKIQKKISLTVPKTPYFKLRRKDPLITSKEYQSARNRNSEVILQEMSFGNND